MIATRRNGDSASSQTTSEFFHRHGLRIGLNLNHEVEVDILLSNLFRCHFTQDILP